MTTRRRTIHAGTTTVHAAAKTVLHPYVTEGAFAIREDAPPEKLVISYVGLLTGARYRFQFRPAKDGTEAVASLLMGGLLGPLHHVLRFRGNRKHVDQLLARIAREAEGETASEDAALI